VAELLGRISSAELAEWMAEYRLRAEDEAAAEQQDPGAGLAGGLGGI
jgi:hypothetical protein